jgi:hypothetical protein
MKIIFYKNTNISEENIYDTINDDDDDMAGTRMSCLQSHHDLVLWYYLTNLVK